MVIINDFCLADHGDPPRLFPRRGLVPKSDAFVKPGIENLVLTEEVKGLFQKRDSLGGGVNISCAEHGIQAKAGLSLKSEQGVVAFSPRFMGIHSLCCFGLMAIDRLHRRIQIENELGRQTRPDHFEVHLPEFHSNMGIGIRRYSRMRCTGNNCLRLRFAAPGSV
ncbi:UNVERIFIED_CONTAM: hypothetical protein ABIC26_002042 [Paenibacillus sp. PvR008]